MTILAAFEMTTTQTAEQKNCPHCLRSFWGTAEEAFCCSACSSAYDLVKSCGLGSFYQDRKQIIETRPMNAAHDFRYLDDLAVNKNDSTSMRFYIKDIKCSSCIWLLEKLPKLNPSIVSSTVSLMQNTLDVTFLSSLKPSAVAMLISNLGYTPEHLDENAFPYEQLKRDKKTLLSRIAIAGFAAGNTMLFAIAIYLGASGNYQKWFNLISAFLYLPVFLFSSVPIYQSALQSIIQRSINIDIPLALALFFGSILSYVSLFEGKVYFDTLSSLVFLILMSRFILKEIEANSKSFLNIGLSGEQSTFRENETVSVPAGKTLLFDGVFISALQHKSIEIDLSWKTGEPTLVEIYPGEIVPAGSVLINNDAQFKVLKTFDQTEFGQNLKKAGQTLVQRPQFLNATDYWARVFLAVVVFFALLLTLLGYGERAMALLVISCPCALSLASPMTYSLSLRELFKKGIILRTTTVIERIAKAKILFFDKTGTLSQGDLKIKSENTSGHESLESIYSTVYSLERESQHPIALALKNHVEHYFSGRAIPLLHFTDYQTLSGTGIEAHANQNHYSIGKSKVESIFTRVDFFKNNQLLATWEFDDPPRESTSHLIAHLKKAGYDVQILSGDHQGSVERFAKQVGLDQNKVHGDLLPAEKEKMIHRTKNSIMIGDGLNDSLALSAAYVGVLVRAQNRPSVLEADVQINSDPIQALRFLILFSHKSVATLYQNIAFSAVYNSIGIVSACMGWVTPLVAAILMPLSAISVFTNAAIQIRFSGRKLWKF